MAEDRLRTVLIAAQAHRDAGSWVEAARLFRQAEQLAPTAPEIKHNLALASFALGDSRTARAAAEAAVKIAPRLWQSHGLLARIYRAAGEVAACERAWQTVLDASPGNGAALLGLADVAMNEFGDAPAAIALARSLSGDPRYAGDAELTTLMATLYTGDADATALSDRLRAYSRANLQRPLLPRRNLRSGSRRVGAISPLFSASPVYHLCWSALAAIAERHELVLFHRSTRRDWATERLHGIAHQWVEVAHVEPDALAERIAAEELDVLFDLGGWADAAGLAAISSRPAGRMYKWVGGQSATTGVASFDGWIGDEWQSPATLQPLYAEPIVNVPGGYVDYTPPPGFEAHRDRPRSGVALVGNPVKVGAATLAAWPAGVDRVTLIDRRYAHARVRDRVIELLARNGVKVERTIVPPDHQAYLAALGACEAIVNTAPYAAGLTAVEALGLGVKLLASEAPGGIFAWRHHLSHLRTGGRNPKLMAAILTLVES